MAKNVDMVNGKMFPSLMQFAIPVIIANVLQAFYSIVSHIVVGKYESSVALGAVGSAMPIITIIQTIFWGMSLGTNVLCANSYGAGDMKRVKVVADTGVVMAILSGVIVFLGGQIFAIPIANSMGLDPEIHKMAVQYMQIYFIGLPFHALYNYVSAVLRAIGDAKRPMYASIIAGFVNLFFSIVFVKELHLGVKGSAFAMMLAHMAAAITGAVALKKSDVGFSFFKMKPSKRILIETVKVGLPSGIQSSLVSFTALIGVSVLNSFGAAAVAANAIVANFATIVNTVVGAITAAVIPFTSQNIGAKKYNKINKLLYMGWGIGIGITVLFIGVFCLFKNGFISLFMSENDMEIKDEVMRISNLRFMLYIVPYFLVAFAEIPGNILKGMGKTMVSLVVGLFVSCGFKILWQLVILPMHKTLGMFFVADCIGWVLCSIAYTAAYIYYERKLAKTRGE
ncbi:MAG: MATE family efflux transporter, partial [Clostridia bacterium]|nr:MATE family efflux transporter [Clostridia bacterium]